MGLRQSTICYSQICSPIFTHRNSFEGRRFILHYSFAFYIIPVRLKQWLASLGLGVGLNAVLLLTYSAVLFSSRMAFARGRAVTSLVLLLVLILVGGLDILGTEVCRREERQGQLCRPFLHIDQDRRADRVEIPHVMGDILEVAGIFAGIEVERNQRVRYRGCRQDGSSRRGQATGCRPRSRCGWS